MFGSEKTTARWCGLWIVCAGVLSLLAAEATSDQPFHIGLNFLNEEFESDHFGVFILGEFDATFRPFPLTDPANQAVTEGALVGWSEADARRGVALVADEIFRAVTTLDPDTTLALQVHIGPVPTHLPGRRINVILGTHEFMGSLSLGQAVQNSALNETALPNDDHGAFALLDNLDALPSTTLDAPEKVFWNIAGTAIHEVGHIFDMDHISVALDDPPPIMSTNSTGLSNNQRLFPRYFTDAPMSQGTSDAHRILRATMETVHIADFDLSGTVTAADDGAILLANLGRTDALFQEGDTNADHWVTASDDGAALLGALAADAGAAADPGTSRADYNPSTGELTVHADGVARVSIFSSGQNILPDAGSSIGNFLVATLDNPSGGDLTWIALSDVIGTVPDARSVSGRVIRPGTPIGDLELRYQRVGGDAQGILGEIALVPEPASVVLLLLLVIAALGVGRLDGQQA